MKVARRCHDWQALRRFRYRLEPSPGLEWSTVSRPSLKGFPMLNPRAIAVPIFDRSPVPFGRLGDIAEALQAKGEDVARLGIRKAGRGWAAGETIHRFPSADALRDTMAEDATRCPEDMGGGTRGMGPARVGWRPLSTFLNFPPCNPNPL